MKIHNRHFGLPISDGALPTCNRRSNNHFLRTRTNCQNFLIQPQCGNEDKEANNGAHYHFLRKSIRRMRVLWKAFSFAIQDNGLAIAVWLVWISETETFRPPGTRETIAGNFDWMGVRNRKLEVVDVNEVPRYVFRIVNQTNWIIIALTFRAILILECYPE